MSIEKRRSFRIAEDLVDQIKRAERVGEAWPLYLHLVRTADWHTGSGKVCLATYAIKAGISYQSALRRKKRLVKEQMATFKEQWDGAKSHLTYTLTDYTSYYTDRPGPQIDEATDTHQNTTAAAEHLPKMALPDVALPELALPDVSCPQGLAMTDVAQPTDVGMTDVALYTPYRDAPRDTTPAQLMPTLPHEEYDPDQEAYDPTAEEIDEALALWDETPLVPPVPVPVQGPAPAAPARVQTPTARAEETTAPAAPAAAQQLFADDREQVIRRALDEHMGRRWPQWRREIKREQRQLLVARLVEKESTPERIQQVAEDRRRINDPRHAFNTLWNNPRSAPAGVVRQKPQTQSGGYQTGVNSAPILHSRDDARVAEIYGDNSDIDEWLATLPPPKPRNPMFARPTIR